MNADELEKAMNAKKQVMLERKFYDWIDASFFDLHTRGCQLANEISNKSCEIIKKNLKNYIKQFVFAQRYAAQQELREVLEKEFALEIERTEQSVKDLLTIAYMSGFTACQKEAEKRAIDRVEIDTNEYIEVTREWRVKRWSLDNNSTDLKLDEYINLTENKAKILKVVQE